MKSSAVQPVIRTTRLGHWKAILTSRPRDFSCNKNDKIGVSLKLFGFSLYLLAAVLEVFRLILIKTTS